MKSIIEYIAEEDYARYNELLDMAAKAKANAPKAPRKERGPMSLEQKLKMAEGRKKKAEELLAKLLAEQNG